MTTLTWTIYFVRCTAPAGEMAAARQQFALIRRKRDMWKQLPFPFRHWKTFGEHRESRKVQKHHKAFLFVLNIV